MKKQKNSRTQSVKAAEMRPVDVAFDKYAKSHQNPTNKLLTYIITPLTVFSLLGLFWAIPFPYLKFLGQYNGFLNWASLLMAFSVYFYYKLSPVLSYLMLFVFFAFSYGVMELGLWEKAGGPPLGSLCLILLILCRIVQFIGYRYEGKTPQLSDDLKFILIGPIWLLHLVLRKSAIGY